MTREDIIRMAREAGFVRTKMHPALERFAELIADAEREECAKVCDEKWSGWIKPSNSLAWPDGYTPYDCAKSIRSRSIEKAK